LIACFVGMIFDCMFWSHGFLVAFFDNMVLWQLFLWSSRWLRVFCVFGAYKVRTFAGVACFFLVWNTFLERFRWIDFQILVPKWIIFPSEVFMGNGLHFRWDFVVEYGK
jgi:hypothetical protein